MRDSLVCYFGITKINYFQARNFSDRQDSFIRDLRSIEFQPAAFSTAIVDDQVMFEISNVNTAIHFADFDSFEYTLEDPVNNQGSV